MYNNKFKLPRSQPGCQPYNDRFIRSSSTSSFIASLILLKSVDQPDHRIFQKTHSSDHKDHSLFSGKTSDGIPEDFKIYIASVGLVVESGLLVLPHRNHYFYDFEELKRVKTIVNLMKLNHVRDLRGFVRKLSELLHYQANFVGCFVDNKTHNRFSFKYNILSEKLSEIPESYEIGIESRIPFVNRIYNFMDAKTDRSLTRKAVTNLLNEFGFEVVNMTEHNGMTYFYSKKVSHESQQISPEKLHSLRKKVIPS